ncbi:MAG: hypothetical protein ACYCYM_07805 [Saccharofermentanales bacterium]
MKTVTLVFENPVLGGFLDVTGGTIAGEQCFALPDFPYRHEIIVTDEMVETGAFATIVSVHTEAMGFSFFLRDVSKDYPIYLKRDGVVVTQPDDGRNFEEVVAAIENRGGYSELERIATEPEESFEHAVDGLRRLESPTWLGISRDVRFFEVGIRGYCAEQWDCVSPKYLSHGVRYEATGSEPVKFQFISGRGIGPERNVVRRLEGGFLPILNSTENDGHITYHTQYFVTYERRPLDAEHLEGTDMYVADSFGAGATFTDEQRETVDKRKKEFSAQDEETVMYIRVTATNNSSAPVYAFFKLPDPRPWREYDKIDFELPYYDGVKGFGMMPDGMVYLVATIGGKPIPQDQISTLLPPHASISCIYKIPHKVIDTQRATQLGKEDYDGRLAQAEAFWRSKLAGAADISLPEPRIEEMMKAGLLHIETGYFGKNNGPVVPIVGIYTAIGSESSPGIQYLDAMGNKDLAERALEFFNEKQRENGDMRNFGGYMLEPGFAVWSMGEHYKLTRDDGWAAHIAPCVIKACRYLSEWREQNLKEELRGNGYGMIAGKVADPDDLFHSYMLNAGAYGAFTGAAELLSSVDPGAADSYRLLAAEFRENIRDSLFENIRRSPVIPLGNGQWISSFSPWTEYRGPLMLYAQGGRWFSHGAFSIRETLGAQYLVLLGVVDADEPLGELIAENFAELMNIRNVSFSQPYYSPHPYINLKRGDVKAFLKEFYNNFAALADRETYSFWEHFWHASPHKLHEEGWFLMRCRWMLALEDGDILKLLAGVPRAWLQDGKCIKVSGMRTYFGKLSYEVCSSVHTGIMQVRVKLEGDSILPRLSVRLPHPTEGVIARCSTQGVYIAVTETVIFDDFQGTADFELKF